jgi:hypothetical protein
VVRKGGLEPSGEYATGAPRSLADSVRGEIFASPRKSHVKDISYDPRLFKPFKNLQEHRIL